MACKSPRTLWVTGNGRFSIVPPGSFLPGQDRPVHPDFAGFSGPQSKGMQSGQIITIDCRTCSSCIVKYQNALIGACLAETSYAQSAVALHMTYANDAGSDTRSDLAHKMLTGSHVREFSERLRKARGFGRVRYLVAGEYGPLHGRAHFHAVLIFEDGMPDFDFSSPRYNDNRIWPYGFISASPITSEAGFAYACKYAVKSTKAMQNNPDFLPGVETVMRRSRIPPLGEPFFLDQARRCADFGIPLSMRYMPPGGLQKANYHVRGKASRLRMAHAYLDQLDVMGYDVSVYDWAPLDHVPVGSPIPRSPDLDIARLLNEAVRERRLAALPVLTPRQDFKAMRADLADREAKQERINALQAERREAARVRRAKARNDAFSAHFLDPVGSDDWIAYDDEIADQLLGSARRRLRV